MDKFGAYFKRLTHMVRKKSRFAERCRYFRNVLKTRHVAPFRPFLSARCFSNVNNNCSLAAMPTQRPTPTPTRYLHAKQTWCWAAAGKTTTRTTSASIGNAFNTHTTYPPPSLVRVRGASLEPWDLKAASGERGRRIGGRGEGRPTSREEKQVGRILCKSSCSLSDLLSLSVSVFTICPTT